MPKLKMPKKPTTLDTKELRKKFLDEFEKMQAKGYTVISIDESKNKELLLKMKKRKVSWNWIVESKNHTKKDSLWVQTWGSVLSGPYRIDRAMNLMKRDYQIIISASHSFRIRNLKTGSVLLAELVV